MTAPTHEPTPERRHSITGVSQRGILGGHVNWCSCGASIVEPDGGHEATDAHLAGPPNAPRPRKTRRFTDEQMAAHDAQVRAEALREARRGIANHFGFTGPRGETPEMRWLWDEANRIEGGQHG